MEQPVLIGLNGPARSGKDTTADRIIEWCAERNISVARRGFADKLKESAAHSLGVFEEEILFCNELKFDGRIVIEGERDPTDSQRPQRVITGREYLQYYGTEAHRDVFGYNFWVDALLPLDIPVATWIPSANEASIFEARPAWWQNFQWQDTEGTVGGHPADVCLITDCRFGNEAARIISLGGEIWRIERDGSGAGSAGKEGHPSEQDLPGEYISLIIDNNGSLQDLATTVDSAMEEVMEEVTA